MLSRMQISKVVPTTKDIPELKLEESEPKVAEEYVHEISKTKQKYESVKSNELNQYENEVENTNEGQKSQHSSSSSIWIYMQSQMESFNLVLI